ncbi:MAG: penicillin-binding transpeptidase domain-containing protein, partial [bacterium]
GKYISSFVGFAPVENPAVLVLVLVENPRGAYYGGVVAAPAFREITRRALWHLKVPPSAQPSSLVAK